ncbi:MAG: hypothetical protein ANABAC_1297 [Anaerolineae bacterium]|nr:MAG: hypothetical protein ANABAC_1297 [Anaerolineae bacterium]
MDIGQIVSGTLISFMTAGSASLIAYWLTARIGQVNIRRGADKALVEYYEQKKMNSTGEVVGEAIAKKLPISLETWQDHLRWAQRGGKYKDYTIGRLVFTSVLYGGVGLIFPIINPAFFSLLVPIGAAVYPFIALRAKANTVRKRVLRLLPETAALISAELAAGNSPEKAVERAAQLPGALSGLLKEAIAATSSSARPLFSRKPVQGTLVETFRKANLPALTAFASQLDLVASKGVGGAELMAQIAETLVGEYRARLASEVEKLDSRLTLMVMFFYFAPFVIFLLATFLTPVLSAFGS